MNSDTQTKLLEHWPLDKIMPYEANARMHSGEQIANIAASITQFGFLVPCLVDRHGILIAGHGRLLAARQLGLTTVPVLQVEHLSEDEVRAYRIADNRLTELGDWDEALLTAELHALNVVGFDLPLLGFDDADIARLMAPLDDVDEGDTPATEAANADEVPEPPSTPVTRPGDLWLLGDHRLLCGDSTDPAAVSRVMVGAKASLCFTSPPYANQRAYTTSGIGDWDGLMTGVFRHLPNIMRDDGQILINLGLVHRDNEVVLYWSQFNEWMRHQGWRLFGWYVWAQGPGLPGDWNGRFAPSHEFVFHFNQKARKPNKIIPCKFAGQDTHLRADGHSTALRQPDGSVGSWTHAGQPTQDFRVPDSVIDIMRHKARGIECRHPAVFPTALVDHIVRAFTDPGDIVFDPFGGSGTSLVACEVIGRFVRAIELAPEYCDIAVLRFHQQFPAVAVILDSNGRSFEQISAERQREAHADA